MKYDRTRNLWPFNTGDYIGRFDCILYSDICNGRCSFSCVDWSIQNTFTICPFELSQSRIVLPSYTGMILMFEIQYIIYFYYKIIHDKKKNLFLNFKGFYWELTLNARVSDCCLTPTEQYSAISWRWRSNFSAISWRWRSNFSAISCRWQVEMMIMVA